MRLLGANCNLKPSSFYTLLNKDFNKRSQTVQDKAAKNRAFVCVQKWPWKHIDLSRSDICARVCG